MRPTDRPNGQLIRHVAPMDTHVRAARRPSRQRRAVVRSARHCARASCVNTERGDAVRHEAIVRREESTRGAGEDAE